MKKIITIILLVLVVSCHKVTVLEVKNVDDRYIITYDNERYVSSRELYTLLGVHNFLTVVADDDLSGWEK